MFKVIWHFLVSFSIMCATGFILYLAVIHNTVWAKNIITFYIWILFFGAILLLFADKKDMVKPWVPHWFGVIYSIAFLIALVAKGWMLLGTLYLISVIFNAVYRNKPIKSK